MNPSIFEPLSHNAERLPFMYGGIAIAAVGIIALFISLFNRMAQEDRQAARNTIFGILCGVVGLGVLGALIFFRIQASDTVQDNLRTAVAQTYGLNLDGAQAAQLVRGGYDNTNYRNPAEGTRYGKTHAAVNGQPVTLFLYYAKGEYRLATIDKSQELPRR